MCSIACKQSQWEAATWHKEFNLALCGHPEGRGGRERWEGAMGGSDGREVGGGGRHIRLIHVAVWHKPRCKAVILHSKNERR